MDLVDELRREFGSHLNADILHWDFAAGYGEVIGSLHASAFMNSQRDPKKNPDPFTLPVPWSTSAEVQADVTAEERLELHARLLRNSAFAD